MKLRELFKIEGLVFSINGRHFQERDDFLLELSSSQKNSDLKLFCGQKYDISHINIIDPCKIITVIRDEAFEIPTCGCWPSKNLYLDEVTDEFENELAILLSDFFTKRLLPPQFKGVKNIKKFTVVNHSTLNTDDIELAINLSAV